VTFGATWLLSILVASVATSIEEADDELGGDSDGISPTDTAMLYIPIAGPFISIATYDANASSTAVLMIDGIAQAGGLAMLIVGLTVQQATIRQVHQGGLKVTPIASQDQAGMALSGTF